MIHSPKLIAILNKELKRTLQQAAVPPMIGGMGIALTIAVQYDLTLRNYLHFPRILTSSK
jgi:hypothetical protein